VIEQTFASISVENVSSPRRARTAAPAKERTLGPRSNRCSSAAVGGWMLSGRVGSP